MAHGFFRVDRSGHDQYGLWGPGERDRSIVIRVGGDLARYQAICAEATVAATFGVPYAMPYERDRPILLCRGLRGGLRSLWPQLVHIDGRAPRPSRWSGAVSP